MFFSKPTQEQALALAAVFQCCELVAELAHQGETSTDKMTLSMGALLNQNPSSIADLYGSAENLSMGINSMRGLFNGNFAPTQRQEVLRYVVLISYLARKLSKDKTRLGKVGRGIERAGLQAEHFSATHDNVINNIAGLYEQTISTMRLRIRVQGSANYLRQPAVAARIRCLLFCAIRNAFLWRQLGGTQTQIMARRSALVKALPQLQ